MPRTPPIIMPNSPSVSWFTNNSDKERERQSSFDHMEEFNNLSPFTYSPSDDGDIKPKPTDVDRRATRKSFQTDNNNNHMEDTLFHKPISNKSTQYNADNSQYELLDEEDSQNGENQPIDHDSDQDNRCDEEKFNSAVDELRSEFQVWTDEYKEFKRYVDTTKRELVEYIQNRNSYFQQRGDYLNQKWNSLQTLV